ncbi:MAG TPA: tetratricopeptide repeat protein, partial [Myxococcota bacterium]|nr:tetratricopeptide repeat protein [Myxococcota bacterium]
MAARAQQHPTFPLTVLADELRDVSTRLDALDAGDLRLTLRAVLSWSVRTLKAPTARLFGLLGIAPGPDISLLAAASLNGVPMAQVRVVLQELELASLVQQYRPGRYRMHDLVRLYATETAHHQLAEEEREEALRRVMDFYTHTAHAADRLLDPYRQPIELGPPAPGVQPQPLSDVPAALTWFEAEYPVLLAAQRAAASRAWYPIVWQLAGLETFNVWQGHVDDRLAAWQAALDASAHLPDITPRIIAHRRLGDAYTDLGRHSEGMSHLHQALALAEEHRDSDQQARTHRVLAWAWARQQDDRKALQHAIRARDLYRTLDQPVGEANALNEVGWCAARLGDYDTARAHCQAALTLHRLHHYTNGEALTLNSLGDIARLSGHHRHAIDYFQQALALLRALGNHYDAAETLENLG